MLNMKKTLVLQLLMVLNLLLIYPVLVVARTGYLGLTGTARYKSHYYHGSCPVITVFNSQPRDCSYLVPGTDVAFFRFYKFQEIQ